MSEINVDEVSRIILETVRRKITEMADKWSYETFCTHDVIVTEEEDKVCFSIKGQKCRLAKDFLQTAFIEDIKLTGKMAIAIRTVEVLDTAEFWFRNYGRYFQ